MLLTYCTTCGARVTVDKEVEEKDVRCADCIAGKTRRSARRGDSAVLRRSTTSRILKKMKKDE